MEKWLRKNEKKRDWRRMHSEQCLAYRAKQSQNGERGLSQPDASHIGKLTELLGLPVEQTADEADTRLKFLSTVKREVPRILSVGVMLAACVCYLMSTISTDSTIGAFGLAAVVFCFDTMIREKKDFRDRYFAYLQSAQLPITGMRLCGLPM